MEYLLSEIYLYMGAMFFLGLVLGWLIWRYGRVSGQEFGQVKAERTQLTESLAKLRTELEACKTAEDAARAELDAMRAENTELTIRAHQASELSQQLSDKLDALQERDTSFFAGEPEQPQGLVGPEGGEPDDLQRIHGVRAGVESMLNAMGIFHYWQIAQWTPAEVAWVDGALEGFNRGGASRDRWLEQAHALWEGG
jgi:predicted flap endonuclease-1-like 5' DNA nuclease